MDKFCRACPVRGCDSLSNNNIRFFRYPTKKTEKIANLWSLFTRVKDFKPITSEALCELHFAPETIKTNKNGRQYLQKDTVPTIYYKNGEKITVQYDPTNQQYVGYEAEELLQEIEQSAFDEENELLQKRYDKIKEIKTMCRFCFSSGHKTPCVAINKLSSYSVDPAEMMIIIGIDQEYSEPFNEIICANCFDRFVDFSNYRKRCQNAQKDLIQYMQDLDQKIAEIQKQQRYHKNPSTNWMKVEIQDQDTSVYTDEFYNTNVERDVGDDHVEEFDETGTQDDISYESEYLEDIETEERLDDETDHIDVYEITIKNEPFDSEHESVTRKKRKSTKLSSEKTLNSKKVGTALPVKQEDQVLVVPGFDNYKNKPFGSKKKIYECFFCRQKFIGKTVYKSHKCEVKRFKCEVEGCDLYFVNQGGYNIHIQRKHALPKTSRHSCPICRTNFQMSAAQFDEHCKKCQEENQYKEHPIRCDKCKKVFKTLQSFTAHAMFHDEESLKKLNEPSEVTRKSTNNKPSLDQPHMCDLCGRVFKESFGLKRHQSDVHFLDFDGQMFYCDLCPIAKPTKRLLYNHMKATHIIRWHSCEICGKVFKNRELWRKHQLVHGDYKKNNLCSYCPHRPGFVTSTALKKHMAKHHGGAEPIRKFLCDVPNCGAAYSRDDQLTRHRVSVHQIYHNNYNENIIKHYVNG